VDDTAGRMATTEIRKADVAVGVQPNHTQSLIDQPPQGSCCGGGGCHGDDVIPSWHVIVTMTTTTPRCNSISDTLSVDVSDELPTISTTT